MLRFALIACLLLAGCTVTGADALERQSALRSADSLRVDSLARERQDSINRAQPGYVVDSILPPAEERRRFLAASPGMTSPDFRGGAASRDLLAHRFLASLSARDTASLRAMVLQPREFAELYYDDSPFSHPPYRQPMSLAWRTIQDPSGVGLNRLLARQSGRPFTFVSQACDPLPKREGATTRFTGCLVRYVDGADTVTRRLYGSILQRGGKYKFLSYTNDF